MTRAPHAEIKALLDAQGRESARLMSRKSGTDVARSIRWLAARKQPRLDTAGKSALKTMTGDLTDRLIKRESLA